MTIRLAKFIAGSAILAALPYSAAAQNPAWGTGQNSVPSGNNGQMASLINSLAEPEGGSKGNEIEMRVPANAHLSEIIVYYDESPDRVNGIQMRYQPDLESRIFSTNFVGQLKGKSFRIPVPWNEIVTGITTQTDSNGNLVAFKLESSSDRLGYISTDKQGEQTKSFGDGLLFAGLKARADKKRVYALGMLTVPASEAPERANYNSLVVARARSAPPVRTAAPQPVRTTQNRPPEKTGFAKALEDFSKQVEQNNKKREFEAQQAKLRKEQQDRNNARARAQAAQAAAQRRQQQTFASSGVNGLNVGTIYFETSDSQKWWGAAGKFEAASNDPSQWRWYITRSSNPYIKSSPVNSFGNMRVIRRDANSLVLGHTSDEKIGVPKEVTFNFAEKDIKGIVPYDDESEIFLSDIASTSRATGGSFASSFAQPTPSRLATTPKPALTSKSVTTMDASLLRLGGNTKAIIYTRCNYQGKAIGLYDGSWTMARLKQAGFEGLGIASIKLAPNKQITLRTQATKATYTADKSCLRYPVHARPAFTSFDVATRPALAAGKAKPAGFTPRKADKLQWTPAGVTGNNIGSAWYESNRTRDGVNYFQRGRFEISEEGSDIWHWYVHSSSKVGNLGGRGSFDKPIQTFRLVKLGCAQSKK